MVKDFYLLTIIGEFSTFDVSVGLSYAFEILV